jgi:hypothetical protein
MTDKQVKSIAKDYIKKATELSSISRFLSKKRYDQSQEILIKEYTTKMDPLTDEAMQMVRDAYDEIGLDCNIDKDGRDIMSNALYEKLKTTVKLSEI